MMTGLYIVRKRGTESAPAPESAAGRALQQLAALDGAKESLHQVCQRLAAATDRAAKLYTQIQAGTEEFIAHWNAAHPDEMIQRCRGAESKSTCLRYTRNEHGLCDACRAEHAKWGARFKSPTRSYSLRDGDAN